jgi:type I restriction enzyme R subunit
MPGFSPTMHKTVSTDERRGEIPLHLFDRSAETQIVERRLPHWSQPGAISFLTWRTNDSLPREVLDAWFDQRDRWLHARGIDPYQPGWHEQLGRLDRQEARSFLDQIWNHWHDALDECKGECVLRRPVLSKVVAKSLLHFDGVRYVMLAFVVMPNHVHLLAAFVDEQSMLDQCEHWKHYTATQINRRLGQKGRFWQQDGFDHLVRSEAQFEYLRKYIAANPTRARLSAGEYRHYSRPEDAS